MALYELEEFASYVQSDVDTATSTLLRDLTTGLIEEVSGEPFDPVPVSIKALALEVAARAYRNPTGVQSRTQGAGPFSNTDRWDVKAAGVFLTAGERATIAAAAGKASPSAYTIDTVSVSGLAGHSDVCALWFGAGYCSCGSDIAGFPLYELEP